jgi:hypothetical protein
MPVVTITGTGLGSATAPNNFTISIIDYQDNVTVYATGVTRTELISGYNVTVSQGDVTVKATSTGTCTSFATVDVSTLALQSFRPNPVEGTTSIGSPDSLSPNGGRDGGNLEYMLGDTFVYPFMSATDFTLTHVSTTGASGLSATGGPFVTPTLETRIEEPNDTTLLLIGYTRSSYSLDASTNTSIYRVTYTPSGLSRDFNYYWVVGV